MKRHRRDRFLFFPRRCLRRARDGNAIAGVGGDNNSDGDAEDDKDDEDAEAELYLGGVDGGQSECGDRLESEEG